ncbi:MAG: alpha mannosidase-like protein [Alyxoria varia]|nr:MAG: alpha mannosidase-like protein [Alyxoria varia]
MSAPPSTEVWYETSARLAFRVGQVSDPIPPQFQQGAMAHCMTIGYKNQLRRDTIDLYYHGFDNYMNHAFPEDELKPITCRPLTRDTQNEGHIELNDSLGNYSLTLIDSLTTLAILASAPPEALRERRPLEDFQNGVLHLVNLYGDGTKGKDGQGLRARGFDIDSKVQVFETVIRGVGGLVSAHLFAEGHLPINGYDPKSKHSEAPGPRGGSDWPNGLIYDGQLLRLAQDLANRLLPAFQTPTSIPYPRVNLRRGIPFYSNSPINQDAEHGQCEPNESNSQEITETCSAGAGSLVLEFTTLSHLTGDPRFETLARKAFEAIWDRKSSIGLIGAGIDPETGQWITPYTGIGAGVDSFFEYAMKGHVLLSAGTEDQKQDASRYLTIWKEAHQGIKHHLFRDSGYQHPHYIQGDLHTGAARYFWIDSLSAYYPSVLTLSGELEEAISTHLLSTALWTRYSALPERWNAASGTIDLGLRWWGGRPEFIESTWYLFHATKDPFYMHVGEMVLRDIEARCRTPCGWAGLEDVRTGEMKDRMESFFLGETAKYLYLLFDPEHPLNHLDKAFVFTTEGHPVILPSETKRCSRSERYPVGQSESVDTLEDTCPIPPVSPPFTLSATTSRGDFFHAANLARLHQTPALGGKRSFAVESSDWDETIVPRGNLSQNGRTYYPWTLPPDLVPANGISSKPATRLTFDLSFPSLPNAAPGPLTLQKVSDGVLINSISAVKLGLIREPFEFEGADGSLATADSFRIHYVSHIALGRDEKVLISPEAIAELNPLDPYFTKHRDFTTLDIMLDLGLRSGNTSSYMEGSGSSSPDGSGEVNMSSLNSKTFQSLFDQIYSALQQQIPLDDAITSAKLSRGNNLPLTRPLLSATAATGVGAAPLPDVPDAVSNAGTPLQWTSVFVSDEACDGKLPPHAPRDHQVIVMKRGSCTFSEKLRNIPSFAPSTQSLQIVLIVSFREDYIGDPMTRPLLDDSQYTPSGILRRYPIPMVMVHGDEATYAMLKSVKGVGLRRRYHFSSQGLQIGNLVVV